MKYSTKRHLVVARRGLEKQFGRALAFPLRRYHYAPIDRLLPNDVVCAGYPKSGNTWVQNLFASALYGIDGAFLPDRLTQELVPDLDYKWIYKRVGTPMVFKSHEAPRPAFRRVILLTRDPRDVMASYVAVRLALGKDTSAEAMILEGDAMLFGSWHEHSKLWIENPYGAEIHLMRYEDLRSDPVATLQAALTFLGVERPAEVLERAVAGNDIKVMKVKEEQFGFDKSSIQADKWVGSGSFVRDGNVGGAKKELSEALLGHIVSRSRDEMAYFGYDVES